MMPFFRFLSVLIFFIPLAAIGQQHPLPDFTLRELSKGKVQISWENPYPNCVQLAIQRSEDSSKNFRTIFSSQSPELASNGFVDNKPIAGKRSWYRIFYSLQGGAYFFSKARSVDASAIVAPVPVVPKETPVIVPEKKESKKAESTKSSEKLTGVYVNRKLVLSLTETEYKRFKDSIFGKTKDKLERTGKFSVSWKPTPPPKAPLKTLIIRNDSIVLELETKTYQHFKDSIFGKTKDSLTRIDAQRVVWKKFAPPPPVYVYVYRNDSLVTQLTAAAYKKFRDSIATKTKDTLFAADDTHASIHSFVPKYVWKPSDYIFTNTHGYVTIRLPEARQHKYHVIFYEEDGTELFRIRSVKETELILDKTDFIHAGWFFFELFEEDKLKEKNKFYLAKD
jgi:hypothetical protein